MVHFDSQHKTKPERITNVRRVSRIGTPVVKGPFRPHKKRIFFDFRRKHICMYVNITLRPTSIWIGEKRDDCTLYGNCFIVARKTAWKTMVVVNTVKYKWIRYFVFYYSFLFNLFKVGRCSPSYRFYWITSFLLYESLCCMIVFFFFGMLYFLRKPKRGFFLEDESGVAFF